MRDFLQNFMKETYKTSISCETSSKLAKSQKPTRCMFCLVFPFFSLFLCFLFLRTVLGRGVAVRGVILKNKKAGGGVGGEGAAPPPQMHWVLLHLFGLHFLVLFFRFFPCSYVFCVLRTVLGRGVAVRGVILKHRKAGGGLGGRAQRLPPRCIGCCRICSCCMSCSVLLYLATTTTPSEEK